MPKADLEILLGSEPPSEKDGGDEPDMDEYDTAAQAMMKAFKAEDTAALAAALRSMMATPVLED